MMSALIYMIHEIFTLKLLFIMFRFQASWSFIKGRICLLVKGQGHFAFHS